MSINGREKVRALSRDPESDILIVYRIALYRALAKTGKFMMGKTLREGLLKMADASIPITRIAYASGLRVRTISY